MHIVDTYLFQSCLERSCYHFSQCITKRFSTFIYTMTSYNENIISFNNPKQTHISCKLLIRSPVSRSLVSSFITERFSFPFATNSSIWKLEWLHSKLMEILDNWLFQPCDKRSLVSLFFNNVSQKDVGFISLSSSYF